MKRKVEAKEPSVPISAVAARRSRQQIATTVPSISRHTGRGEEPPLKKSKPSPKRPARKLKPSPSNGSEQPSGSDSRALNSKTDPIPPAVEAETEAVVLAIEEGSGYDRTTGGNMSEEDEGETHTRINENFDLSAEESAKLEDFPLSRIPLNKSNVVYDMKDALCVRMKLRTTLVLIGQYDLWIKRGVVSLMGAKLHARPNLYRIYAPSTHSLPVIKSIAGIDDYAEIEIRSCYNSLYRLKDLSNLYHRIWNSKNTGTDKNSPKGLTRRSFAVMYKSSDDPLGRPLRPLHLDKKWSASIKALSRRGGGLRALTCGPKGAGKSTFNRYLLNHLLSPPPNLESTHPSRDGVAFLDLDPGQPEFSPMGQVYLSHLWKPNFGPPFSHPTLDESDDGSIVRAHHLGTVSPKDDPDHYTLCALDLMNTYWSLLQTYPQCPLIINFPGWIFGQGLEIAIWLIKSLGISDVVYMSEKGPAEVVDPLHYASVEANVPLTTLPSQPTDFVTRSSYQQRTMQIMSYFHFRSHSGYPSWSELPIYQNRPLTVNYDGLSQGILGVMVSGCRQNPDFLSEILDGSVVGVVAIENNSALGLAHEDAALVAGGAQTEHQDNNSIRAGSMNGDGISDTHMPTPASHLQSDEVHPGITRTKENIPYLFLGNGSCTPLDPKASRCLGLAIVRSINTNNHKLELLTPIPRSALRNSIEQGQRIVLVRGQLDNPNWALSEEYFAALTAERQHRKDMMRQKTSGKDQDPADREQQMKKAAMLKARTRRAGNGPWRTMVEAGNDGFFERAGQQQGEKIWALRKKAVPLDTVERGTELE